MANQAQLQAQLMNARAIFRQALPRLLRRRNVVACGLGFKQVGGEWTDELSLVVSVERKLPKEQLTPDDLIPPQVDGLPTDVQQTGRFRALTLDPRRRYRPAQPGLSVGHYLVTAGTFGYLVRRGEALFILSNNHVLANTNAAQIGDPILQPARLDGGTVEQDRIAALSDFVRLDFGEQEADHPLLEMIASLLNALAALFGSSVRLRATRLSAEGNLMDAALARVDDPNLVIPGWPEIGRQLGQAEPQLGMEVQKFGRTTGYTRGIVRQVDVAVNVEYQGRTAHFVDQVMTDPMSAGGDSGSAILDRQGHAVGLLFAGSEAATLFTPIARILEHFRVELV